MDFGVELVSLFRKVFSILNYRGILHTELGNFSGGNFRFILIRCVSDLNANQFTNIQSLDFFKITFYLISFLLFFYYVFIRTVST